MRAAVCERQDSAHSLLAATEEEHLLGQIESLRHVGEALLVLEPLDCFLHLGNVAAEGLDQQRIRDGAIVENLAVTKLCYADPHVLVPVVFAFVLVHEASCKILQGFPASLAEGAASVDGKDQVLLGDADLITAALVRVALPDPVPNLGFPLGATPVAADGNRHPAPPLRE